MAVSPLTKPAGPVEKPISALKNTVDALTKVVNALGEPAGPGAAVQGQFSVSAATLRRALNLASTSADERMLVWLSSKP